jgi:hypothetical protein
MPANTPQLPIGDSLTDYNGNAITVGATVKLIGTVTAVNALSQHYRDITVQLSYPVTGVAQPQPQPPADGGFNTQPGSVLTINVPGCVLIVGS